MIKKFNFPCDCTIKSFSTSEDPLMLRMPFMSRIDEEFWQDSKEEPINQLTISIREDDDYGREDVLSYLIYKEQNSVTLWIIAVDISNDKTWVWIVSNSQDEDREVFLNYCNNLKV